MVLLESRTIPARFPRLLIKQVSLSWRHPYANDRWRIVNGDSDHVVLVAECEARPGRSVLPMTHVFISYASRDHKEANHTCQFLEENGYKVWIAPRNIPAGHTHSRVIPSAISDCSAIVVLLSDATNESSYVPREIDYGASLKRRVIPVRLFEITPTSELRLLLGPHQWIDAFKHSRDEWLRKLIDALESSTEDELEDFQIQSDISASPTLLLASVLGFFVSIIASLWSISLPVGASQCTVDRTFCVNGLGLSAAVLSAFCFLAALLIPALLPPRYHWRNIQSRDAVFLGLSGTVAMFALAWPMWLLTVASLGIGVLYLVFVRRFVDGSRAIPLALVSLGSAIVLGGAAEAYVLRTLSEKSASALVLFEPVLQADAEIAGFDYDVFKVVRGALDLSVQELRSVPEEEPDPISFRNGIRSESTRKSAKVLFQQALLKFNPFQIVLIADARVTKTCAGRVASVMVDAKQLLFSSLQPGGEGRTVPLERWQDFDSTYPLEADGKLSSSNREMLQLMVGAHIVDWVFESRTIAERHGGPVPLDAAAAEAALENVLRSLLRSPVCVRDNGERVCPTASGTIAQKLELLRQLYGAMQTNATTLSKFGDAEECNRQGRRELYVRTRGSEGRSK